MRCNIKLRHKYYNPAPFSPNFILDTNYLTFSEALIISKTDEYFPRNMYTECCIHLVGLILFDDPCRLWRKVSN